MERTRVYSYSTTGRGILMLSKCIHCGGEVVVITSTSINGKVYKCDRTLTEGITPSGRNVEVFLIHDCNRGLNQVNPDQTDGKRFWTGGNIPEQGNDNKCDRENGSS